MCEDVCRKKGIGKEGKSNDEPLGGEDPHFISARRKSSRERGKGGTASFGDPPQNAFCGGDRTGAVIAANQTPTLHPLAESWMSSRIESLKGKPDRGRVRLSRGVAQAVRPALKFHMFFKDQGKRARRESEKKTHLKSALGRRFMMRE